MTRRNFFQVLQDAQIDLWKEYQRLSNLFYFSENFKIQSIYQTCEEYFINMPFRDTCLDINDFNDTHDFHFRDITEDTFSEDDLIIFCEYSYNFVYQLMKNPFYYQNYLQFYVKQLNLVNDKIGYMFYQKENEIFILVPKDQVAISVAEIVDDDLSYRIIEYHHYSMKGDIEQKKSILLRLAHKLEPLDDKLKNINDALKSNLFFMFNNLDLRHNNTTRNLAKEEKRDTNYKQIVADMTPDELEDWYDETYQLCLLAFLELDNVERMQKIDELKKKIKS